MIDFSLSKDKKIGMIQTTKSGNLCTSGCVGKIISYNETNDGRYIVSIKGENIFNLSKEVKSNKKFRVVKATINRNFIDKSPTSFINNYNKNIIIEKYIKIIQKENKNINENTIREIDVPLLIKFIAMSSPFQSMEKQILLEAKNLEELSAKTITLLDFIITKRMEVIL